MPKGAVPHSLAVRQLQPPLSGKQGAGRPSLRHKMHVQVSIVFLLPVYCTPNVPSTMCTLRALSFSMVLEVRRERGQQSLRVRVREADDHQTLLSAACLIGVYSLCIANCTAHVRLTSKEVTRTYQERVSHASHCPPVRGFDEVMHVPHG